MSGRRKRVGILGFNGITALDLVGPMESFAAAFLGDGAGGYTPCYEVCVIGLDARPFTATSGLTVTPRASLAEAPSLDTLIVPGGFGLRAPEINATVAEWLARHSGPIRRVASVCTGIYGLAPTGLLDGRRVTTHWAHARDLARRFPRLEVDPDVLFIKDGKYYTSAGITAGIDLALALIEEDFGQAVALGVARGLVVYLKRPGGQEQYSEPLRLQAGGVGKLGDLAVWLAGHLAHDLSVPALAERVNLSPRQFSRRFKAMFGAAPAAYVETARLDEIRRQLVETGRTIESIALSVGFESGDVGRRAFERRFGIAPSLYRERFARPEGKIFA
ncbi:MAG TPA: GlxA family transcriptional regulator [Aliidongia sp.]|nr:GlxA family transcriptional regulator [Aliidongia sp.]